MGKQKKRTDLPVKPLIGWNNEVLVSAEQLASPNPLVTRYGFDPEGHQCKDCAHMYCKIYDKAYWKCELREDTNGPGSDHRKKWPACAKFQAKSEN